MSDKCKGVSFDTGVSMDLDADVWGGLPFEMVGRILSFLPVPDLCRLRTVSKKSNRLIRKRKFGAIHGHNAQRRDASSFIVMLCTHIFRSADNSTLLHEKAHQKWCFFDLEAQRWYTLKDHHHNIPHTLFPAVAAMDGGLVCQISKTEADPGFSIIVFNPIADTLREIPSLPAHVAPEFAEVNLVVDSVAQQFKVLLINHVVYTPSCQSDHGGKIEDDPLVSIYDSATNEWRSLSNPPWLSTREVNISVSIVMFQGLVYALFGKIRKGFEQGIWRCSLVENAWERVNVDMDSSKILSAPLLFVSADRLFMMAWLSDGPESAGPWQLEVSEIRASGMARERLFEMSKPDVMDVFAVKCDCLEDGLTPPRILASGCGNSLLFTSISSGKLMVLDLETLEWEQVPPIPVTASQGNEVYVYVGKQMNLILPSTLWWQCCSRFKTRVRRRILNL